jgi:large subunit ribosomal protein L18
MRRNKEKRKAQRAGLRRKYRVKKKVFGSPERPRLSIYKSNRNMYAQIIDDVAGVTLASASTLLPDLKEKIESPSNCKASEFVGETVAKRAMEVGIKCVRFDRNRCRYQGRVKALADGARKAGLVF